MIFALLGILTFTALTANADDGMSLTPGFALDKPVKNPSTSSTANGTKKKSSSSKPHMISEVADKSCLPNIKSENVNAIQTRYKLSWNEEMTESEQSATARAASQLGLMLGLRKNGRSWLDKTSVVFVDELPVRSDGGCMPGIQTLVDKTPTITFARRCPKKSAQGKQKLPVSDATIVHEYGHVVANRGDFYSRYNAVVEERCKVSGYCTHSSAGRKHKNRNEEFAEVFAAYVVAPDRLQKNCPDAFRFMREEIFRGASAACKKDLQTK